VRAGYSYFPQSKNTMQVSTDAPGGKKTVSNWPDPTTAPTPYSSWNCVPPFKQTQIDQSKSMVVDEVDKGFSGLAHRLAGAPQGVNATFGDGHVNWQGIKSVPAAFNQTVLAGIQADDSVTDNSDFMFSMSCWMP
jgi:prepilin-type processing-associated H-X9-DG protein